MFLLCVQSIQGFIVLKKDSGLRESCALLETSFKKFLFRLRTEFFSLGCISCGERQLYSHGLKGMESLWGRTTPLPVSPCAFQVLRIPYKLQSFVVQKTAILTDWRGDGAGGNIIG